MTPGARNARADTLDREVQIARIAARLRVETFGAESRAGDHAFERGARAGLAHLWPLLEALDLALLYVKSGRIRDEITAAIDAATGETL